MMEKFDNWIGVLIAEMECTEGSIAEQMNLKCRTKYPIFVRNTMESSIRIKIKTEQEIQSILHLMVLFDRSVGMEKIQKVLEGSEKRGDQTIKSSLQVLYMQYLKDPQSITEGHLLSVQKRAWSKKEPIYNEVACFGMGCLQKRSSGIEK